ncbi:MAG: DRTGG domain-containing protein [Bacillota bacterium]
MKIFEVVQLLEADVRSSSDELQRFVIGGYASDLLSDVMAHAVEGCLWVTLVAHQNVTAVAALVGIPAIVIVGGAEPDEATLAKAGQEKIVVMTTHLSAYEVCGRLYQAGLPAEVKRV